MFSQNIKNPESNEIYRNSIFSGLPELKKKQKKKKYRSYQLGL